MKFRIFIKAVDSSQPGLPAVPDDHPKPWHESQEAARIWLLEEVRKENLAGKFEDYVIQPFDDEGHMLERTNNADADAAARDIQWLAAHDPELRHVTATMLAARQLYSIAVSILQDILITAKIPEGDAVRPAHPLATDVIVQGIANAGQQGFNELDTFQVLVTSVMPWLKTKISGHVKQEALDRVEAAKTAEKIRRETPVLIGISADKRQPATLARGKALVLVGYGPAVQCLLNHVINTAGTAVVPELAERMNVIIRLCDAQQVMPSENQRLLFVGRKHWQSCTYTKPKFAEMVRSYIAPQFTGEQADLLIIDDLAAADMPPLAAGEPLGGLAPFRCASAHKRLMEWVKYGGMAMVAGVPVTHETPIDLSGPEWENLRTFAIVRPVTVIRQPGPGHEDLEEGKVRLMVGRDAFQLDVDPVLIEPVSQIVLS